MQNRTLLLVLVVVGAIFLGVTMTVQQINSPIMQRLVEQQTEILKLQRKMERQLSGQSGEASEGGPQAAANTGSNTGDTQQRLASLEQKLDGIADFFKQARQPQAPTDEYTKVHPIDISSATVRGNKNAPVTIVEFVDFQCPFCARFHPVINEVLAAYPDKVNYVLKHFPLSFHPLAKPAGKAVLAAGEQGKYHEMVELILKDNSKISEPQFEAWAKELGLNMKKYKDDLKNKDQEYEKLINADFESGAKVDVRGTPTYYLNGRKTMARDLATYKREIDAILEKK